MSNVDSALKAVRAAGLKVIIAGEDDKGTWIVSLGTSRSAPMKSWRAGRGATFDGALMSAMRAGRSVKPKPAPTDFEDILS